MMRTKLSRRHTLPLFALPFLAACGAAAGQSGTDSGVDVATAAADESIAAAAPGTVVFQIVPQDSQATFRVREQLAGVELPNDAVGTTGAVSGQIALNEDGTLAGQTSKITVDLSHLATDSSRRDTFIKQDTLNTSQYPLAEFVPTSATGLPSPLPAGGAYDFTLSGPMTVHGVKKDVTWNVSAVRADPGLTGTASTSVTFGDFGMTPPQVPVVLSVTDQIRLEVSLVATQVAAAVRAATAT
jgi:polyisoprenoid-binding protein YceI